MVDLVLRIDPTTGTQTVLATYDLLGVPTGFALASGRRVLVANSATGTIVQIDPSTCEQVLFASGGYLGSPFGIVVVHKLELRGPTVLSDGRFKCLVFGDPGQVYLVECTTDFNTWSTAGAVTNVTELVEFIDPTAPGYPYRFYRARPQNRVNCYRDKTFSGRALKKAFSTL